MTYNRCWQTTAHWAKNGFYISNGFKKIKRRGFCDIWKLYEIPILVSLNKFVLKYSKDHSLSMAAFMLQQQNWAVLIKPKLFTLWPFRERVCQSLICKQNWPMICLAYSQVQILAQNIISKRCRAIPISTRKNESRDRVFTSNPDMKFVSKLSTSSCLMPDLVIPRTPKRERQMSFIGR